MKYLIINGPNLNLLGVREPAIYGSIDYPSLVEQIASYASSIGVETAFYQSNHEGAILDYIHANYQHADGIVINPGALTHYSFTIVSKQFRFPRSKSIYRTSTNAKGFEASRSSKTLASNKFSAKAFAVTSKPSSI